MNIRETLIAARNLIVDPEHWTQGTYAIENTGNEVYPDESNAYAFCAAGALARVSGTSFNDAGDMQETPLYQACFADLSRAARSIFDDRSITSINDGEMSDHPEEAHRDVLAVFQKAINDA